MKNQTLNVYLNQNDKKHHVGQLIYHERAIIFEYQPELVASNIELSPFRLP